MTDGEIQYNAAVLKYDHLCKTRADPSQWSDNIIDATVGIVEKRAWTNFYTFLADDRHKYVSGKTRTLEDVLNEGPIEPIKSPIEFKTVSVKNGNVTHIRVTPDISNYIAKAKDGGKPLDSFPEAVDEKAPG